MSRIEDFIIENNVLVEYVGTDENVVIPEGVTKIGKRAFEHKQLKTVELPKSLKIIDELAFYFCTDLSKINFQDGITMIKSFAFNMCKLLEVEIPKSVKKIGREAFSSGSLLTIYCKVKEKPSGWHENWNQYHWDGSCSPVVWDCDNNRIAEDGFRYVFVDGVKYALKNGKAKMVKFAERDVVSVEIPSQIEFEKNVYSVTSLGKDLFFHSSLREVKIPDSVIELEEGVFSNCHDLEKIKLPNSITKIPSATFNCSKELKEVYLGDEVTVIGDFAFAGCKELYRVTLPKNLKHIGEKAFFNCSNLTEIIIPDGVEIIEENAFAFSGRLNIYCALPSRPAAWSDDLDNCRIVWNFNKDKKELLEELSSLCTEEQLKEIIESIKKSK